MARNTSTDVARRLADLRSRLAARYPALAIEFHERNGGAAIIGFSAPTADELGSALDVAGLCQREAFEELLALHNRRRSSVQHCCHPCAHDELGNRRFVSTGLPYAQFSVIVEHHGSEFLEVRVDIKKARREVARLLRPFLRAAT